MQQYADEQLEYLGSLRGRLGYQMGAWTPFVTGGLAFASTRWGRTDLTTGNQDATPSQWRLGYTFGGGVDYALDRRWTARAEYLYTRLPLTGFSFSAPARYDSLYDLHQLRFGLNYHFGVDGEDKDKKDDDRGPMSWEIHGQSTFIFQGYPAFNSPYEGPTACRASASRARPGRSRRSSACGCGRAASSTTIPSCCRASASPTRSAPRASPTARRRSRTSHSRATTPRGCSCARSSGLGGERETIESDYGQLAGDKDVSRLTFQIGKFAVHDIFDGNDYAEDSRTDFLNWSIWAAGAFDYPADRVGLTYGITAELNQQRWAARVGYFLVGNEPNANVFDMNLFSRGGYVGELEMRYEPFGRKGVAKFGTWLTSTFAGSYNDAVAIAMATGVDAPPHHRPDAPGPHQVRPLSSTCSRTSPTTSARSPASAGTTAAARSAPSPTSTRACRAACSSRARRGAGRTTASASPARGT